MKSIYATSNEIVRIVITTATPNMIVIRSDTKAAIARRSLTIERRKKEADASYSGAGSAKT